MNLAPQAIDDILLAPRAQALALLSKQLSVSDFDAVQIGQLATALFRAERFDLLVIVFRRWTQADPRNPEPWSNLGLSLSREGEFDAALQALNQAIEINPQFAAAYINRCTVHQFLGDYERHLRDAQTAALLQPHSAIALNNLGIALLEQGQTAEAKQVLEQSQRADPRYFEASFNLARVASDEGRHEDATRFLEAALDGPYAAHRHYRDMIEYHLSFEYLIKGRVAEGFPLYERGFSEKISPAIARTPRRRFNAPLWQGERLQRGQRLMIWREQGIGDELRFATLLPLLNGSEGEVIVECEPRLIQAFTRSLPNIQFRAPSPYQWGEVNAAAEDYDYQVPVGSLPLHLMHRVDAIAHQDPLLLPDPELAAVFTQRLSEELGAFKGKRKVGICWRSSMLSGKRNKKYTQIDDWASLLSDPDSVFINLQYGDCEEELQQMESVLGIRIIRWDDVDLKQDIESVLALISQLDLVISVSAAVVPLAGAVGTPTLMLSHPTWLHLSQTEFYPWFSSVKPVLAAATEPVASCLPRAEAVLRAMPSPAIFPAR